MFYCDYKKKRNNTIKLTSERFHVRKEVIIVLYTADQARPIMTEGWTEQLYVQTYLL